MPTSHLHQRKSKQRCKCKKENHESTKKKKSKKNCFFCLIVLSMREGKALLSLTQTQKRKKHEKLNYIKTLNSATLAMAFVQGYSLHVVYNSKRGSSLNLHRMEAG